MPRLELIFLHSANGAGCFRWRDVDSTHLQSETVRFVPVAQQIARCTVPGKGLGHLAGKPDLRGI